MKSLYLILYFLFIMNIAFSQNNGEVSYNYDNMPEVFMEGLSDTLIWSGNLIISFSDMENFPVEEIVLVSYMVREKDNAKVICGNMLPNHGEPCKEDFEVIFGDIEKKIRQFDFYEKGDKNSLCSKRGSFLLHFVIIPK